MPVIVKAPEQGTKVKKGDTLAKLAADAGPDIDWKMIARLNWGTDRPAEVVQAIIETIGLELKDLLTKALCDKPEDMPFSPHKDVKAELRIPEVYKTEELDSEKTHTIKVKTLKPAPAVGVVSLDKWFIPEVEECEVKYELFGVKDVADKVRMDVFGSNYCDCTDWSDGKGVYDKGELEKEPVYTKKDLKADEHADETIKWKGDCTTEKGMLSVKVKDEDKRHVNVAFSPYTVQMTYHKADLPDTDRPQIVLKPFWPAWKMKTSTPSTAAGMNGEVHWKNDDDQDGGALVVEDAEGVIVFRKSFNPTLKPASGKPESKLERPKELEKGDRKFTWNKKYRKGVLNGKMEDVMIDDSAWTQDMQNQFLYRSTPYKATVTTVKPELEAPSLKIEWKVLNSGGKFKRGLYRIKDRTGRTVFIAPLPEAKMADGEHDVTWDGKYPEGVKNTLDGDEITSWDMPYRVEVQMHTEAGEAEGLALAAEHSEIRLYTHNETFALDDPRYDPEALKASMMLAPGPLMAKAELEGDVELAPGIAPKDKTKDEWFRYKLAENGYHPGPVHAAYDDEFKTSLQEFKRSVPADGSASAGNFTRLKLGGGAIELRDAAAKTAIETLRAMDKRLPYGDLTKVMGNNDVPDLTEEEVKTKLRDVDADIVIWADERQYYTDTDALDENNRPFLKAGTDPGSDARVSLGLEDYRGGMVNGDGRVATDKAAIPRPCLPMQAHPTLMGRKDELFSPFDDGKVKVGDEAKLKAIRAALGPLRLDWSVDELPFDVSPIDPGDYPDKHNRGTPPPSWTAGKQTRTRRYVAWALWDKKAEFTPKATKRKGFLTNCPATEGGVRPTSGGDYAKTVFGVGDEGLWPFKSEEGEEAVATVLHCMINKDQGVKKTDKPLVADLTGLACANFRPSIIAGDGYRVGARMTFKKVGAYDFPNLEALEKRYPVAPQANGAKMRVWRRSSFRGYACWAGSATGHWNATLINRFRMHYKSGHVYFVHEGGGMQPALALNTIYDTATPAHVTKYQNVCANNLIASYGAGTESYKDPTQMSLNSSWVHPWGQKDDLGIEWMKPDADRGDLEDIAVNFWRSYRAGLLMGFTKQVEANGFMRGHLFVEFQASPDFYLPVYDCVGGTGPHRYVRMRKRGSARHANGDACPVVGCGGTLQGTLQYSSNRALNFPAVGAALGATWLFTSSDAETWTHEVGHHRHFEHAANGPGFKVALHDSEDNTATPTASFETLWWSDASHKPSASTAIQHREAAENWDRRCIMSYTSDGDQYFCGKCALRNRGWKVEGLGAPGSGCHEPP